VKLARLWHSVQFVRLKIKLEKTADCVIVGYVTETREIASLALGLTKGPSLTLGWSARALVNQRPPVLALLMRSHPYLPYNPSQLLPGAVREPRIVHAVLNVLIRFPITRTRS